MLVAVASLKGSPGTTTTALALALGWPAPQWPVLVECDPAGGELAARFGLAEGPGLVSLAAELRRTRDVEVLARHTQRCPLGVDVITGPAGADRARAVVGLVCDGALAGLGAGSGTVVIADCGRLDPGSPAASVFDAADARLLVTGPRLDCLVHVVAWLTGRRQRDAAGVGLLLAGDGPYPPGEVASTLGVPVAGVMPADDDAANVLSGDRAPGRGFGRLPLMQAARALADALVGDLLPVAGPVAVAPSASSASLPRVELRVNPAGVRP